MLKAVNHGVESSDDDQDLDQSFHSSQEEDLKKQKEKEKKSKKSDKKDKKQKKDKKSKKRSRESSSEAEESPEDNGFKITVGNSKRAKIESAPIVKPLSGEW